MTLDLLFAKLLRDCVDQAVPVDTGIPSTTDLPRFHQQDGDTGAVPCLIFLGVVTNRTKVTLTIGVDVIYRTHPAVEDDDDDQARADLIDLLDSVSDYLQDPEAWAEFLESDAASNIPEDIAIIQRTFGEPGRTVDGPNKEQQHLLPITYLVAIGLPTD